jgi:phosphoheptose isomerase
MAVAVHSAELELDTLHKEDEVDELSGRSIPIKRREQEAFLRHIESLVNQGDLLVAISTSGSSPNVVCGVEAGTRRGAFRVALTGETGGALAEKVDLLLNVPSRDPQRIQEAHITIGHIACSLIEEICFSKKTLPMG